MWTDPQQLACQGLTWGKQSAAGHELQIQACQGSPDRVRMEVTMAPRECLQEIDHQAAASLLSGDAAQR